MYDTLAPLFDSLFEASDTDGPISIYEHILVHLDPSGAGLLEGGFTLPDDMLYHHGHVGLSFAPGAREAVIAYHGDQPPKNTEATQTILAAARAFGEDPTPETFRVFYTVLRREEMMSVIDEVLSGLSALPDRTLSPILKACMGFLYKAPDRGPVKFSLAVLGQTDEEDLLEDFQILARHDEFTVYAAVAVEKILEQPLPILFDMAKAVTGWGRIELVQRLQGWPERAYREWLLMEGFRNTVLDEYLAYAAATEGQLLDVLRADIPTDAQLDAACDIITALIRGGPSQDMTDYEDGAAVVELYVEALMGRRITISQFVSLFDIQDFLEDVDINWETRMAYGWTPHRREVIAEKVTNLMRRTDVLPHIQDALTSEDTATFDIALQAADLLDLNIWDVVYQRILAEPDKAIRWYDAARRMTPTEVDEVLSLARTHFDLDGLSSGPALETGVGSEFGAHDALMFVVQELSRFAGQGWDMVHAALFSPIVPNRWTAIRTIELWSPVWWSTDMSEALERLLAVEPHEDLRDYITAVLQMRQGQPDLARN